jgi:hypothetical protein
VDWIGLVFRGCATWHVLERQLRTLMGARMKMKATIPRSLENFDRGFKLRKLGIRLKVGTRIFSQKQSHQVIANIRSRPKIGQNNPNYGIGGLSPS